MPLRATPFDPAVFDTDYTNADMLAAYNDATRASIDAFARPGALERTVELPVIGEVSGEAARAIHFTDTVTHTWDLARALGRDPGIDNDIAELALHYAHIHYRDMPRGPDSPFLADEVGHRRGSVGDRPARRLPRTRPISVTRPLPGKCVQRIKTITPRARRAGHPLINLWQQDSNTCNQMAHRSAGRYEL